MACYINIENRYRSSAIKERQILQSGLYLGIASVAISAGGAVYGGMQADKAGRAQSASARKAQKTYEQGLKNIGIMEQQMTPGELLSRDMPALTAAAQRSSQTLREEGEKYRPGAEALRKVDVERSNQAYQIIGDYMGNRLPPELDAEITRIAAERYGAGVQPGLAAAGAPGAAMQAGGFAASRMLGLGALQLQQQGLEFLNQRSNIEQNWAQIAKLYTVGEFEGPAQYALGAGELQQQQMNLQLSALTGQYNAQQNVGAARFAQGMGNAQSWLQGSQSVASSLGGMSTGISSYQQARQVGNISDQMDYNRLMASAIPSQNFKPASSSMPSMSDRPYQIPRSQFGAASNNASIYSLPSAYA